VGDADAEVVADKGLFVEPPEKLRANIFPEELSEPLMATASVSRPT
jgi:hypothetical protein